MGALNPHFLDSLRSLSKESLFWDKPEKLQLGRCNATLCRGQGTSQNFWQDARPSDSQSAPEQSAEHSSSETSPPLWIPSAPHYPPACLGPSRRNRSYSVNCHQPSGHNILDRYNLCPSLVIWPLHGTRTSISVKSLSTCFSMTHMRKCSFTNIYNDPTTIFKNLIWGEEHPLFWENSDNTVL